MPTFDMFSASQWACVYLGIATVGFIIGALVAFFHRPKPTPAQKQEGQDYLSTIRSFRTLEQQRQDYE
jgi:hypothetical protein